MRGLGRIGQRAQHIEDRPHPDLPPRPDGVFHRPVQHRRKQESDAHLVETASHLLRRNLDMHPQRLQHIRGSALRRHRAIPVLGHANSRSGHHERGRSRDVERARAVAPGPAGIQHHFMLRAHPRGLLPHHLRGSRNLLHRLPLGAQAHQKRRDLRIRGLSPHNLPHHPDRFLPRQVHPCQYFRNRLSNHDSLLRTFYRGAR